MESSIQYALNKVGYPSVTLKSPQRECIEYVYHRKDVFLWLPTGFGKSLCYEVLPFIFDSKLGCQTSIVIVFFSPRFTDGGSSSESQASIS